MPPHVVSAALQTLDIRGKLSPFHAEVIEVAIADLKAWNPVGNRPQTEVDPPVGEKLQRGYLWKIHKSVLEPFVRVNKYSPQAEEPDYSIGVRVLDPTRYERLCCIQYLEALLKDIRAEKST